MTDSSTNLKLIVHENNEVTIKDGRGVGVSCHECRFSGWRSESSYKHHEHPPRCLFNSGGRDPVDGDRIVERGESWQWEGSYKWNTIYPRCEVKNADGNCSDFVRAKLLPWWNPLRWIGRSYRTRKVRE